MFKTSKYAGCGTYISPWLCIHHQSSPPRPLLPTTPKDSLFVLQREASYPRLKFVGLRSADGSSLAIREVLTTCGRLTAWDGTGTKCTPKSAQFKRKMIRSGAPAKFILEPVRSGRPYESMDLRAAVRGMHRVCWRKISWRLPKDHRVCVNSNSMGSQRSARVIQAFS